MFQNSTLPSVSVDIRHNLAGSLPRLRAWQGFARLEAHLPLPNSFGEYLLWLVLMVGMVLLAFLQIHVSLQISQAEVGVATLRSQSVLVEQENAQLLWEISHYTTLERVEAEARAAGFVPALKRRYVTPDFASLDKGVALPLVSHHPITGAGGNEAENGEFAVDYALSRRSWLEQWEQLRQDGGQRMGALFEAVWQAVVRIDISQ